MGLGPGTEFVESAGVKDIIESEERAENYSEEENETDHAEPTKRRAGPQAGGALLGEFELEEAQELFRIGRFLLAVTAVIHRQRILTYRAKDKWILSNQGQTGEN